MEFKKVKQAYKIQKKIFADVIKIRALLKVLQARYCDEYPSNYLTSVILNSEKLSEKALKECYQILRSLLVK